MAKVYLKILALFLAILVMFGFSFDKPKVLIIGDSISIGYTPYVKEELADIADVYHNEGNAQHTGTGLQKIEEWIGNEDWDLVQFNWGLWDLCYRHSDSQVQGNRDKLNGTITYGLEEYSENLDALLVKIKTLTNAKLIFVTTSYVPEEEAGRFHDDALKYNDQARSVMRKHGVEINDIYKFSKEIHKDHGTKYDNVHYTEVGYQLLGKHIASYIRNTL